MYTKVRKLRTCHRMYHPKADDIECLYIKRENSGRGLIQLEVIHNTTTIGLKKYLDTTTTWTLQLVNTYEKQKKKKKFN